MSKASEWATREMARVHALEEAAARIEKELQAPPQDGPPVFRHHSNILAMVAAFHDSHGMRIRFVFDRDVHMKCDEALMLAHWIIDTFGEEGPTP